MAKGAASSRFDKKIRQNAWWLLPVLVTVTATMAIIGALGAWFLTYRFPDILSPFGALAGWNYWLIFIGTLGALVFSFYLWDRVSMRRELKGYLKSQSRAKFIANQDRIEELGWRLGGSYEKKVLALKEEYRR